MVNSSLGESRIHDGGSILLGEFLEDIPELVQGILGGSILKPSGNNDSASVRRIRLYAKDYDTWYLQIKSFVNV